VRRAREVVSFADGRAESPLESISRVAFREMGLPVPELQVPLGVPPVGIVDFYWEDYGVVGEADGLLKYADEAPDSLRAEKLRQEALEDLGFIVVRWTWEQIWRQPDWVEMRLRKAFRKGAERRG
jgi:very-short-patch-repair endonuclease